MKVTISLEALNEYAGKNEWIKIGKDASTFYYLTPQGNIVNVTLKDDGKSIWDIDNM